MNINERFLKDIGNTVKKGQADLYKYVTCNAARQLLLEVYYKQEERIEDLEEEDKEYLKGLVLENISSEDPAYLIDCCRCVYIFQKYL